MKKKYFYNSNTTNPSYNRTKNSKKKIKYDLERIPDNKINHFPKKPAKGGIPAIEKKRTPKVIEKKGKYR